MIIHVLVTRDGDRYHAHTLEFDLMTVGDTPGEAMDHLYDQVEIHVESCYERGFASLDDMKRPAPQEYFDRFEDTFFRPDSHVFRGTISLPDSIKGPQEQAATTV